MSELTREQKQHWFLVSLPVLRWNISATCKLVGVGRSTFYTWLDEPEFKERYEEAREALADYLEEKSLDIIELGDGTQLRAHLQATAKDGGWGLAKENRPRIPEGGQHIHLHLPPEPKSLADWERQVQEARAARLLPSASGSEEEREANGG